MGRWDDDAWKYEMNDIHAMKIWYVMKLTETLTLNLKAATPQPPPEQTKK